MAVFRKTLGAYVEALDLQIKTGTAYLPPLGMFVKKNGVYSALELPGAVRIASLFSTGNAGAWYDPRDMSTLFQDSGGTSPVTAMEQPVGLMRDKSGRGNHAVQPTAINRPVLSARVNLLTKTEQLNDVSWTIQAGVTVTQVNGPEWEIDLTNAAVGTGIYSVGSTVVSAGFPYAISASIRSVNVNGTNQIVLEEPSGGSGGTAVVCNLTNSFAAFSSVSLGGTSSLRGVWFKKVSGGALVIRVKFIQVEIGPTATRYQRVNTATDYDSVGFAKYLAFNGVNSCMSVPNIDLSVTNKLTIIAGLRKLADAPDAIFVELSVGASSPANTGSFYVTAPEGPGGSYKVFAHGNVLGSGGGVQCSGYVAPISNVLSATLDLSVASPGQVALRVNALNPTTTFFGSDGGNGSFQAYPLFIGSRANGSLFFNGNLYGLIVNGALLNTTQIAAAERYTNTNTRAY